MIVLYILMVILFSAGAGLMSYVPMDIRAQDPFVSKRLGMLSILCIVMCLFTTFALALASMTAAVICAAIGVTAFAFGRWHAKSYDAT